MNHLLQIFHWMFPSNSVNIFENRFCLSLSCRFWSVEKKENTSIEKPNKVQLRTSPRQYYFLMTSEIGESSSLRILQEVVFEKRETDSYSYKTVGSNFLQIRKSLWTNHYRRKWKKLRAAEKKFLWQIILRGRQ